MPDGSTLVLSKENAALAKRAKAPETVGGKSLQGDPESLRKKIDGPANIRDAPEGKVIGSFPDQYIVLALAQKGEWFLVRGYWEDPCVSGWTHRKNLVAITRAQIDAESGRSAEEATEVKAIREKAFKAYLFEPKSLPKASALAEKGIQRSTRCKYRGSAGECVNALHVLHLLQARIAMDRGDMKAADRLLVKAAKIPKESSFETFGPNTTLARAMLEKGRKEAVLEYLELSKKFWTGTPSRHNDQGVVTHLPKGSVLADRWISEIKAGKIPAMDEVQHLDWVWTKKGWGAP
jgi:hypothetical protein